MAEMIAVTPRRNKVWGWDGALCNRRVIVPCCPQRVDPETLESGRKAVMAR